MQTHHLSDLLLRQPKNGQFSTIAIDGRGGSGKSTFAKYLKDLLPEFIVLNGDDYFEPTEGEVAWGDFNDERFERDVIEALRQGNSFTYRPYDWHATPHISDQRVVVNKGLILERCYAFSFALDWDLKMWVDTPREVCLERGFERELLPKERIREVWTKVWQPREDEYIERLNPLAEADLVIDGTSDFRKQLLP
jgi:uridine kinase